MGRIPNTRKKEWGQMIKLSVPKENWKWIIGFNALNMLDAGLTMFITHTGGRELNPLMAFLINQHPGYFVLTKFLVGGIMTAYWIKRQSWKVFPWMTLAFWTVCVWNLAMIFSSIEKAMQIGGAINGH